MKFRKLSFVNFFICKKANTKGRIKHNLPKKISKLLSRVSLLQIQICSYETFKFNKLSLQKTVHPSIFKIKKVIETLEQQYFF